MSTRFDRERLLEPMHTTGKKYWGALAVTLLALLVFLYFYLQVLLQGHYLTGMDNWGPEGGVPWGLDIGAFAWWVGIAHGGIAISAASRLLKKEEYESIARIAELLTVLALGMAVAHIMFDIGAPDSVFNTVLNAPFSSPLIWDVTVITMYFAMSGTYLVLTLREDIYKLRQSEDLPSVLGPLYSLILLGYDPSESEKMDQMLWWLALGVVGLIVLLSGGVIPWLFNLQASQPGWFGAIQGPAFLTSALASALAAVIIIAAIFRFAYGWEDIMPDRVFAGLGTATGLLTLAYLWVTLHEIVAGSFYASTQAAEIEHMLTAGQFAVPYLLAVVGLVLGALYLGVQTLSGRFNLAGTIAASGFVLVGIFVKKVVYVVAGLAHTPYPLQPTGTYTPTIYEFANLLGTVALVALAYLVIVKVIPILPISALESHETTDSSEVES